MIRFPAKLIKHISYCRVQIGIIPLFSKLTTLFLFHTDSALYLTVWVLLSYSHYPYLPTEICMYVAYQ